MKDVDERLDTLRGFKVPQAPDVRELRRRRDARRTQRGVLGLVVLVALATALFGGLRSGDDGNDEVAVDTGDGPSPELNDSLQPTDFERTATPPAVGHLARLPVCDGTADLHSLASTVDPSNTLGLGSITSTEVPASEVLDRVPVDVTAASVAYCSAAWRSTDQGAAGLALRNPAGELLYAAVTGPDDGSLAMDRLGDDVAGAGYQQTQLGSGQPFVGYVAPDDTDVEGLTLTPTRILGVVGDRRLAARAPAPPPGLHVVEPSADYYRAGVAAVAHLIQTPPALGAPDDFALMFAPRRLPAGSTRCLEALFTTPPTTWWCTSAGVIRVRWSEDGQIEQIDGSPVEINGLAGTVQTSPGGTVVRVEAINGAVLIELPPQLSQEQAIHIAESVPALAPPPRDPAAGEDLRSELSADWIRSLLPEDLAASESQTHGTDQTGLTVTDADGHQFAIIASPGTDSVVPPFATETTSVDGVDVVITTPESSQAVAGFVCGRISWQLVASDQSPRQTLRRVAEAIISTLDC